MSEGKTPSEGRGTRKNESARKPAEMRLASDHNRKEASARHQEGGKF